MSFVSDRTEITMDNPKSRDAGETNVAGGSCRLVQPHSNRFSRNSELSSNFSVFAANKKLVSFDSVYELSDFALQHIDGFNAVNVATAVHRLAKLGCSSFEICSDVCLRALSALKLKALRMMPLFKPQEVANLMWALATLHAQPSSELVDAVSIQTLRTIESFRPQHVSNLIWALAKLKIKPCIDLYESLARRSIATSREFKPQEIANLFWSMATLGHDPGEMLVNAISTQVMLCVDRFKSQEVVNTLSAMTSFRTAPQEQVVGVLLRQAAAVAFDFTPQGLASLLCVLVKLNGKRHQGLLKLMYKQAITSSKRFSPQDIANLMWALASLNDASNCDELIRVMLNQAVAIAQHFSPLDITNTMWALASLRIRPKRVLVSEMSLRARAIADQFKPNEMVLLIWACSVLGEGLDLIAIMANNIVPVVEMLKPQDISNLLWAMATSSIEPGKELCFKVLHQALKVAEKFEPQDISCLLWALAKLRIAPEEKLIEEMSKQAIVVSGTFKAQEVANFLWALATLNIEPNLQLIEAMLVRTAAIVKQFKSQEVCNLLWGLNCLGLQHNDHFSDFLKSAYNVVYRLLQHIAVVRENTKMSAESLCQVHQLAVSSESDLFFPDLNLKNLLGTDFLDLCRNFFERSAFTESKFQKSVSRCLQSLDVQFAEEVVEKQTGYTIDILLFDKDGAPAQAVEVDGPTHFIRLSDGLFRPSGATCLKRRLLASSGLKSSPVPFWQWRALRDHAERKAYLLKLLCL